MPWTEAGFIQQLAERRLGFVHAPCTTMTLSVVWCTASVLVVYLRDIGTNEMDAPSLRKTSAVVISFFRRARRNEEE